MQNTVHDGAPPLVTELDFVLVKPDITPAFFQISVYTANQLFVAIVTVTQEDAERFVRFLKRDLSMLWTNPE